ncbi:hypothetical protein K435DRAFT_968179 [Dendrothele bispora CBS 962.96]|uniref:DUF6533 domain-containing protein n=1 Tax=Dendrothele bispora (strain CBS 962.96) TaxID=1314807 RepID=A0A4S8LQH1_DENBC|nr:hypothetical protein K435DRAFT_968179 [Dendrothele bispora CBS 962.96]
MSFTADSRTVSYLTGIQVELLIDIAGLTLLVWDYLISLDAEIQLVWKAPWKFGKLLYFLTRYLAFAGAIITILLNGGRFKLLETCKALSEASSFLTFIELYVAESRYLNTTLNAFLTSLPAILSLRVWALWENSWKVACLITIGFIVPGPIVSFGLLLGTPQYQSAALSDPFGYFIHDKFGLCPSYLSGSFYIIVMFIYLTVYETVMLAMTAYKARKYGRSRNHTSFIFAFFLYGLTYNVVALTSSAANIIVRTAVSSEGYTTLFLGLQVAMHSTLTSRMLLHIRQEAMDTTLPTSQFSQSLHFAPGPLDVDEFEFDNQRIRSRVSQQLVTVDEGQSWFGGPRPY